MVTAGPYRLLRHPGYAGGLLATTGIGLMWGNWVSLATLTVLTLAFIVWRIHTEESALLATLDDRYRAYASNHKRLSRWSGRRIVMDEGTRKNEGMDVDEGANLDPQRAALIGRRRARRPARS